MRTLSFTSIAIASLACLLAFPAGAEDDETRGIGGMGAAQEKVQQNKLASELLDGQIGPGLEKAVGERKLVPWDKSVLHTRIARTRIAAGALTKRVNDNALSTLLTENNKTSDVATNPYVKLTKEGGKGSYEFQLAERLRRAKGKLAPQDVLRQALDVCHDDYWLATLTAHNLLKEITYAERTGQQAILGWEKGDNTDDVFIHPSDISQKLIDLRPEGDPKLADRMGPWYHAFGLFFVGGITSGTEARLLADLENFTRLLRAGSPPDAGKERVNSWAARQSVALNRTVAKNAVADKTSVPKAKRAPKDLSKLGKPDLQRWIDELKAEHKALQVQLVALPPTAEGQAKAIRAEQKALYQDVMRMKKELARRK